jgi:uncharacterized protein YeaO (DUF488 family)
MAIHIIRLGSPRTEGEGLRIGTVRRPPRGVPKAEFSRQNWYDVWLPMLAPSAAAVKQALDATTTAEWRIFTKTYRSEMAKPEASHTLELLATLSHQTDFSVGCYCENEARCHRSILRELLAKKGAHIARTAS